MRKNQSKFQNATINVGYYTSLLESATLNSIPLDYLRSIDRMHTSYNSFYKWTKFSVIEMTIFVLKMTLKKGLGFFVLKSNNSLQSCCFPVQKTARKPEMAWPVSSNSEGARFISQKNLDHFSLSFLSQKWLLQELRFYFIYSMSSSWCECQNKK